MSIRRQRHEEKKPENDTVKKIQEIIKNKKLEIEIKDENKKEDKPEKESVKENVIPTVSSELEKTVDETIIIHSTPKEEIIDLKTKKYDSVGIMGKHESIGVFKRRVLGKGFKIGKVIVELINEWLLKNP